MSEASKRLIGAASEMRGPQVQRFLVENERKHRSGDFVHWPDHQAALATARNEALEEAAKVADKRSAMIKDVSPQAAIALLDALPLAIRALKSETKP